jgi:hypothetical protein
MFQSSEITIPEGATHMADFYGKTQYYRRVDCQHLNQVSEEWQKLTRWDVWEQESWVDVGAGFSSRRLQILDIGGYQEATPLARAKRNFEIYQENLRDLEGEGTAGFFDEDLESDMDQVAHPDSLRFGMGGF